MTAVSSTTATGLANGHSSPPVEIELNMQLVIDNIALASKAILAVPYEKERGPFTICDFGAGDGSASLPLMLSAVNRVKSLHGEDTEVSVIYEDMPENNFESLFKRAQGCSGGGSLRDYKRVFVYASGTGFYEQCCPTESMHFGYTTLSVHWLSEKPCRLSNALHSQLTTDVTERERYAEQAARDWATFLTARAKELVRGGHFVVSSLAVDGEGQFYGHTKNIKQCYYTQLTNIWRKMSEEGHITKEEFLNTNFNDYLRNEEEFRAPFEDQQSEVYRMGLRLDSCQMTLTRSPYHVYWTEHGNKDDPVACRTYAQQYVPSVSKWSGGFFRRSLDDQRSDSERDNLVKMLFTRYEDIVASCPDEHGADWVGATLCIRKI